MVRKLEKSTSASPGVDNDCQFSALSRVRKLSVLLGLKERFITFIFGGWILERLRLRMRRWWSDRPGSVELTENKAGSREVKMLSIRELLVTVTRVGVSIVSIILKEWTRSSSLDRDGEWISRSTLWSLHKTKSALGNFLVRRMSTSSSLERKVFKSPRGER